MSKCLQLVQVFIDAYHAFALDPIIALRAPDCTNIILPASLGIKPMNNEEYAAFLAPSLTAFRNFHLTVHDITVDEIAGKVAMHLTSESSTDIGAYHNEYMVSLVLTEDRKKIKKFVEFVDSKYSAEYMANLRRHQIRHQESKI